MLSQFLCYAYSLYNTNLEENAVHVTSKVSRKLPQHCSLALQAALEQKQLSQTFGEERINYESKIKLIL